MSWKALKIVISCKALTPRRVQRFERLSDSEECDALKIPLQLRAQDLEKLSHIPKGTSSWKILMLLKLQEIEKRLYT